MANLLPPEGVHSLLRELIANLAEVVQFKEFAQVGESCSDARKLLIFLHFSESGQQRRTQ